MINKKPVTLETADILFTFEKGSMISKAIYWFMSFFQKKKFPKLSHCALYMGEGELIEADFKKGVVSVARVDKYVTGAFSVWRGRYDAMDYTQTINGKSDHRILLTEEKKDYIFAYAFSQLGKPYSKLQLFGILLQRVLGLTILKHCIFKRGFVRDWNKEALICSELISRAYKRAQCSLFSGDAAFHSPADLFNSEYLKKERVGFFVMVD